MNKQDLESYSDAWNAHDIDRIMHYMTDDCVFETGGGSDVFGTRYEGSKIVRERFIEVWSDMPDVKFTDANHFVDGNQGCSEWTFTGTRLDGTRVEIRGCDLFTFRGDKIYSKRSFIKQRN